MLQRKIKKVVSVILGVMMTVTPIANTYAIGGDGSLNNPYRINNEKDLQEVLENIEQDKNWSNKKYFTLASMVMQSLNSFLYGSSKERVFNGTLNGHGTLMLSNRLFDKIGKEGKIKNLNIISSQNGYLGGVNEGEIESCKLKGIGSYGVIGNNYGVIRDCEIEGKFSNGIAGNNYGVIERCTVRGEVSNAGLVRYNQARGKISNCRIKGIVKGNYCASSYGRSCPAGIAEYNDGEIENCTMDGEMKGTGLVYLVSFTKKAESIVRGCIVGEEAKGASYQQMFCEGYGGRVEGCGYEGWNQEDHCSVYDKDREIKAEKVIKKEEKKQIPQQKGIKEEKETNIFTNIKDVALGAVNSLYETFVKFPVKVVT